MCVFQFILIWVPVFLIAYLVTCMAALWGRHSTEVLKECTFCIRPCDIPVCTSPVTCKGARGFCHGTIRRLLGDCISCDWRDEKHVVLRLLKHTNNFARYSICLSMLYMLFYSVSSAVYSEYYTCDQWGIYVASFMQELWPYYDTFTEQAETPGQWMYMCLNGVLYLLIVRFAALCCPSALKSAMAGSLVHSPSLLLIPNNRVTRQRTIGCTSCIGV